VESKEMRRSKGLWFINLAMVGRNYEIFVWNPRR
jgi:hypothetical protein